MERAFYRLVLFIIALPFLAFMLPLIDRFTPLTIFADNSRPVKRNIGYCNSRGEQTIKPQFDWALPFSEGLAAVGEGGKRHPRSGLVSQVKWGYVDRGGNVVIPYRFQEAGTFREGLAWVRYKKRIGFINREGEFVIPPLFDAVSDFSEGLAVAAYGGEWVCGDKGNCRFECETWGYIDRKGEFAIPPKFRQARAFYNGLAEVKDDSGWAFIDSSGEIVMRTEGPQVDPLFRIGLSSVHDGLTLVRKEGKHGFINRDGEYVITPKFDEALAFCEGLAAVRVGEKWGYVDENGNLVLPAKFHKAGCFHDGLAPVWDATKEIRIINQRGGYALESTFEDLTLTTADGWWVIKNGLPGFVDREGHFRFSPLGMPSNDRPTVFDEFGFMFKLVSRHNEGDHFDKMNSPTPMWVFDESIVYWTDPLTAPAPRLWSSTFVSPQVVDENPMEGIVFTIFFLVGLNGFVLLGVFLRKESWVSILNFVGLLGLSIGLGFVLFVVLVFTTGRF